MPLRKSATRYASMTTEAEQEDLAGSSKVNLDGRNKWPRTYTRRNEQSDTINRKSRIGSCPRIKMEPAKRQPRSKEIRNASIKRMKDMRTRK